jgi:hypothetical protein
MESGSDDGSSEWDEGYWWETTSEMFQCCGCLEVVLRQSFLESEDREVTVRFFPPKMSRKLPEWRWKLPDELRLLLDEIYRSLDAESVRLPMMGARALVDMLLTEKVGDVGTFKKKLHEFETKGFVSAKNRAVLDAVLDLGHAASHRGHAASEENVLAVMDIVENMLQAVYIFPAIEERLKDCTPKRGENP